MDEMERFMNSERMPQAMTAMMDMRGASATATSCSACCGWTYGLGRGRDVLPQPSGTTRVFELTLSGGMMGSDVWTVNGKRYPDTPPMRLGNGDRVRVALRNMSMEAHPMHLHGQIFKVVSVNGRRLAAPIVKDSVDVDAHMGTVELEFTAHNPGDWFFHCHKPMHMAGGMIVLAKVAG
jgi:FtsP/CotA-like multicopper oxidase with cupredoxin domain